MKLEKSFLVLAISTGAFAPGCNWMGRLESTVDNCTGSSSINTDATYNGGFTGIFYVVNTGTTSSPFTLSFLQGIRRQRAFRATVVAANRNKR